MFRVYDKGVLVLPTLRVKEAQGENSGLESRVPGVAQDFTMKV